MKEHFIFKKTLSGLEALHLLKSHPNPYLTPFLIKESRVDKTLTLCEISEDRPSFVRMTRFIFNQEAGTWVGENASQNECDSKDSRPHKISDALNAFYKMLMGQGYDLRSSNLIRAHGEAVTTNPVFKDYKMMRPDTEVELGQLRTLSIFRCSEKSVDEKPKGHKHYSNSPSQSAEEDSIEEVTPKAKHTITRQSST